MTAFGEKWGDQPLVASHPIYQYLARAYELKIEAVEWVPAMEIKGKDLSDLKKILAKHPAQWMIWEDERTAENITAINALGLKSVVFSPSANVPGEGDWLSVMKTNIANLEALLEAGE
jgi:zinc transport system substrate-binding protein